jgi:hypothetical protein
MTYLEFEVRFFGKFCQFSCLIHRIGQWLFNEHMFAFAKGHITKLKMADGWRHNIYRIADVHQLRSICKPRDAVFFCYDGCVMVIGVEEAHQFRVFNFFPVVEVIFTQVSCTEQGNL